MSRAQITKGIQAYTESRPVLVFITSAGVERNAIIGNDEVARKKDIPIVQLNPGGTLNHKYAGEWAVRSAELPYTVIRSTGGAALATQQPENCPVRVSEVYLFACKAPAISVQPPVTAPRKLQKETRFTVPCALKVHGGRFGSVYKT